MNFYSAGVMHLLASNGPRIAVLAGFVYLLGRLLGLHPRSWCIGRGGAALYGCLTWRGAAAIRPALLCAAVGVALAGRGWWIRCNCSLARAAIALLIAQPLDLFAAGFQLSFVTVLGLMLLAVRRGGRGWRWKTRTVRVLASFGRLSPIRRDGKPYSAEDDGACWPWH